MERGIYPSPYGGLPPLPPLYTPPSTPLYRGYDDVNKFFGEIFGSYLGPTPFSKKIFLGIFGLKYRPTPFLKKIFLENFGFKYCPFGKRFVPLHICVYFS